FNLIQISARTENAKIGNHPASWTDKRERFLCRKLALLIEPLVDGELVSFAKKRFDCLWSQVTVARADIDDQRIWRAGERRQRLAKALINRLSHHMFDHSAMKRWFRLDWSADSHDVDHF